MRKDKKYETRSNISNISSFHILLFFVGFITQKRWYVLDYLGQWIKAFFAYFLDVKMPWGVKVCTILLLKSIRKILLQDRL